MSKKEQYIREIGEYLYSMSEFPEYKLRLKFQYESKTEFVGHNLSFEVYTTNENVAEVEEMFLKKISKNKDWFDGKLIHTATKEQDDATGKFLKEFIKDL